LKLYFDSNCPVCNSFAKLLKKHLSGEAEIIPLIEHAEDFKLELADGKILHGKEAIETLGKEIPKVKDFFWMLPDSYRGKALYEAYAFGRFLRKVFYFLRGRKCGECK